MPSAVDVVIPDSLAEFLSFARARVDEALERLLPVPPACPAIVSEAMRYSVFAGSKRLRPMLTLAAALAVEDRTAEAVRHKRAFVEDRTADAVRHDGRSGASPVVRGSSGAFDPSP